MAFADGGGGVAFAAAGTGLCGVGAGFVAGLVALGYFVEGEGAALGCDVE